MLGGRPMQPQRRPNAWRYAILATQTKQQNPSAGQRGFAFLPDINSGAFALPGARTLVDSRAYRRPTRHHSPASLPGRAARGSAFPRKATCQVPASD